MQTAHESSSFSDARPTDGQARFTTAVTSATMTRRNASHRRRLTAIWSLPLTAALAIATAGPAAAHAPAPAPSNIAPAPYEEQFSKPTPQDFAPQEYLRVFPSDASETGFFYFHVIDTMSDLRAHHPEIIDQNLSTAIDINNREASNRTQVERALDDDMEDLLETMSDALGDRLGGYFRQALAEHRLPKTSRLLAGSLARAGGISSSTFAEKTAYNNPRPFIVAPNQIVRHQRGDHVSYKNTPSFPSGHTNQAFWKASILSAMFPEFGARFQARAAEVGYNRVVMGVHYPLDVIGGRMTGQAAAADRLVDPEFRTLITAAAMEARAELQWRCQATIGECGAGNTTLSPAAMQASEWRMSYGFPTVYATETPLIVPRRAPELLSTRFPTLTTEQRAEVLRRTAYPAGYPLDDQSARGSWQRINLAKAFAATVTVDGDGHVTVTSSR